MSASGDFFCGRCGRALGQGEVCWCMQSASAADASLPSWRCKTCGTIHRYGSPVVTTKPAILCEPNDVPL